MDIHRRIFWKLTARRPVFSRVGMFRSVAGQLPGLPLASTFAQAFLLLPCLECPVLLLQGSAVDVEIRDVLQQDRDRFGADSKSDLVRADVDLPLLGPDERYALIHLVVSPRPEAAALAWQNDRCLMVRPAHTYCCGWRPDQIVLRIQFSQFSGDKTTRSLEQGKYAHILARARISELLDLKLRFGANRDQSIICHPDFQRTRLRRHDRFTDTDRISFGKQPALPIALRLDGTAAQDHFPGYGPCSTDTGGFRDHPGAADSRSGCGVVTSARGRPHASAESSQCAQHHQPLKQVNLLGFHSRPPFHYSYIRQNWCDARHPPAPRRVFAIPQRAC